MQGACLSPRQEPPLCGGCAPKRACGRSDLAVHRWLRAAHKIAPNGAHFPIHCTIGQTARNGRDRSLQTCRKSAMFPFTFSLCFPLFSPALPQSARRAAVIGFSLLFDNLPVYHAASLTDALSRSCGAVDISPMQSQQTFPASAPSASVPEACQPCVRHLFLTLGQAARTEALRRLCAHSWFFPTLPLFRFGMASYCRRPAYNDIPHI